MYHGSPQTLKESLTLVFFGTGTRWRLLLAVAMSWQSDVVFTPKITSVAGFAFPGI